MAREFAPLAIERLLVSWTVLSSVVTVTIPAFDICRLFWVVHYVVDRVGFLCRRLYHVLDYHLVVDEIQCFLQGRSSILDKEG